MSDRLRAVFQRQFLDDLQHWVQTDRRTALRLMKLVDAVLRDPVRGIGKPELLRHVGAGLWSRRVTAEHRLVYLVRGNRVDFLQCRYHYGP